MKPSPKANHEILSPTLFLLSMGACTQRANVSTIGDVCFDYTLATSAESTWTGLTPEEAVEAFSAIATPTTITWSEPVGGQSTSTMSVVFSDWTLDKAKTGHSTDPLCEPFLELSPTVSITIDGVTMHIQRE